VAESASRARLRQLVQPLGPEEDNCTKRLRLALTMMEAGIDMMRMTLQRRYPQEGPDQIRARLTNWIQDQPHGPEFRDGMARLEKHR